MEIQGYKITRCIGQGGMAAAFLAEQTSLGRKVVLKILDTSIHDSPQTVERFLNEGRIVAGLQHPHIITIYDVGRAGNQIYISMEYVDGGDLKSRLQQQKTLNPAEALEIVRKIASGLAVAHANGIVHRDVKPGNVLFRKDGTPLLSDFGIAKRLQTDGDLTATGVFVGSPNYMAPEQADFAPIDARADIYSLGVILYEMLTGMKPYQSSSVVDVIYQHREAPIPRLPAPLAPFQEMIDVMLAKDRERRFPNCEALMRYIADLKRTKGYKDLAKTAAVPEFTTTGTFEATDTTISSVSLDRLPKPPRVRRAVWIALAGAALAYGAVYLADRHINAPPAPPRPATAAELEAPPPAQTGQAAGPQEREVVSALLWLGQHSLNENRLTAPPKDNAHYYFSRLLQLEPDNAEAKRGLVRIARGYAMLAEREVAQDHYELARRYISIGLQIDPGNEALLVLRDLATPTSHGFLDTVRGLFKKS
ncbi:MAG: serine/threonine protein kinase [Gammaproteobacteria bacterium]|nr:serine/threonine protein kinase [Gammaproteobacteria bacterium]MBI5618932.1 serine/threonine protein kinase [Gammaproteobacteria bacterium]